ncbi:GroES-like protein [Rhizodiscina lignyota]|uniref:alcohol dehydrogenase (NADP(+)) n=1 Tax=Rhizodiscina lignyota TaxID=1504668 RepID=A0A9P4IID8_9PEZI|nr:GroES-like protein [Rhizodiscina lignyota]
MTSRDYKFQGWLGFSADSVNGNLRWSTYTPKPWEETDIDIKVTHCGVCATDISTLRSGWAPVDYPQCVGHEVVGTVVRLGSKASPNSPLSLGDRVGVGAQSSSCMASDCEECSGKPSYENQCQNFVGTYNGVFKDGTKSFGGYSDYIRIPGRFVIKIPDGLESMHAAPMLCAGITVYSPLKNFGSGPGKKVGIVGVGGLGHFGLLFAKALGAEKIVAISRSSAKRKNCEEMGADGFIATDEEPDWAAKNERTLDLIVSTVSSPKMPLEGYLQMLRPRGTFVQVGSPEDKLPAISAGSLIVKGARMAGSVIGPPWEIEEMLKLAVEKHVRGWVQPRGLMEANEALVDMKDGKARYRYVLVNEKHLHE